MAKDRSLLATARRLAETLARPDAVDHDAAIEDFLAPGEAAGLRDALARVERASDYARRARPIVFRPIRPEDDGAVAHVIRSVMTEFGAVGKGFSIEDPEVDRMHESYAGPRSAFWVIERDGQVLGCGGVAPLAGAKPSVCELRKMYFLPALRGAGLGIPVIRACLAAAIEFGFATCYLETLEHMHQARALYRRMGFRELDAPMGATGHHACNSWMALELATVRDLIARPALLDDRRA